MSVLINLICSYNDDIDKFNQDNPIKHQIDIENYEARIKELKLEIENLHRQNLALKENESLNDVVKKIEYEKLTISEESQKLKVDLYDKVSQIDQLQGKLSETLKKLRDLENERKKYKGKLYLGFESMSLDQKRRFISENLNFVYTYEQYDQEYIFSNDENYLFRCNL